MPALWMFGANDSSSVLSLQHLRYSLFRHSKDYYPCGGGRTREANDTDALFAAWRESAMEQAEKHHG